MASDTPATTPAEDEMVRNLRALGTDDNVRRALVKLATVGLTADDLAALAQRAAAGTLRPAQAAARTAQPDHQVGDGVAPRVRRDGPGGFHVATAEGKGTPWWRLVGDNGEVLGHSEVFASLGNAARGADAAERTVIRNAHAAGPALYDVLLQMDVQTAAAARPLPEGSRQFDLADVFGGRLAQDIEAGGPAMVSPYLRLIELAAYAIRFAQERAGGESA